MDLDMELLKREPEVIVKSEPPFITELKCEPEVIVKLEPTFTENSYDVSINIDNLVIKTECESASFGSSNCDSRNGDVIKEESPLAASEHNQENTGDLISTKNSASYIQTRKPKTLTKTQHSCPYCSRNFTRRDSFSIHLWRKHSKKNPDFLVEKFHKKCFTCDIFKFKSSSSRSFKSHMLKKFGETKVFKCNNCDYETGVKGSLVVHILRKHSNDRRTFPCTFCNKTFFNKKSLADHLLFHHGNQFDKSLKTLLSWTINYCSLCDFKTVLSTKLNQHMRKHDTDTIIKCDYETCVKSNLKVHIQRKHSNDRRTFSCTFCNKTFFTKNFLADHLLFRHGGKFDKSLKTLLSCTINHCKLCDFRTVLKSMLSQHMTKHGADQIFQFKSNLRGHIQRNNLNDRPTYSCRFCYKTWYRKQSLVDHLLWYHGEKFEKSLKTLLSLDIKHCNLCDFRVHTKSKLIQHIQTWHSNDRSTYKYKEESLADHVLAHRGLKFGRTIKHCNLYDFRTIKKVTLNRHMIKHDHMAEHNYSLVNAGTERI